MQVLQIWISFMEQLASVDKACPSGKIAVKTKNTRIFHFKEKYVTDKSQACFGKLSSKSNLAISLLHFQEGILQPEQTVM